MQEPHSEPLPGQKINEKETSALVCKQCGVVLETLGLCKNCKNYNLPARNSEYLLVKPEEFAEVTINQTGQGEKATISFSLPDAIGENMTAAEISVIGNENLELGKIIFAFWFQANKDLFPRGNRSTIREVRDYLDDLVSKRRWQ